MWGLCSCGVFLDGFMRSIGVCILLWNGKIIIHIFFIPFFVFGSLDVIEGGVCAHGEEVKTCVSFL